MGDKPIIRIAVPGDSAEEFMQNAAKQFRGDFFVAIDQAVGKFVRIEAPFLAGDVAVRGDAIAMPAVRNGRKGLVIRLVKLDPDSLGIPIPEASKQMAVEEEQQEEPDVGEFDRQMTMASPVSAAVAKSIRATAVASDRAQPVKLQPTNFEDLDDETREAVNEFGAQTTKASEVSADIAKQLAEVEEKEVRATPHAVRRPATPQSGVPKQVKPASDESPKSAKEEPKSTAEQAAADDSAFDNAFADATDEAVAEDEPTIVKDEVVATKDDIVVAKADTKDDDDDDGEAEPAKVDKPAETRPAAKDREIGIETAVVDKSRPIPKAPPSRVPFLMVCALIAAGGAVAIAFMKGWI